MFVDDLAVAVFDARDESRAISAAVVDHGAVRVYHFVESDVISPKGERGRVVERRRYAQVASGANNLIVAEFVG